MMQGDIHEKAVADAGRKQNPKTFKVYDQKVYKV
jgi:hypothetical protein